MPRSPKKLEPKNFHTEDEIDMFQLLRFLVKSTRFWVMGTIISSVLALTYIFTLLPKNLSLLTINDINITQEKLSVVRQIMPAMTLPLKTMMESKGLDSLYSSITMDSDFLSETIIGMSGADLSDKKLDSKTKDKVDTVLILINGHDEDLMKLEADFIRNNLRGILQYLAVKQYLDEESQNAKIEAFEKEMLMNTLNLKYERTKNKLLRYKNLQKEPDQQKDLQITLNLESTNLDKDENDNNYKQPFQIQGTIDNPKLSEIMKFSEAIEFPGAKYLPLSNRIVAIKTEMADQTEGLNITKREIKALKLSQTMLSELDQTFNSLQYQGQEIDLTTMIDLVNKRQKVTPKLTFEETGALDALKMNLIRYDQQGYNFKNSLPEVVSQKGRAKIFFIALIFGGLVGLISFSLKELLLGYRQRF